MINKKVLVIDNMKDVAIEEHAYFNYHLEKEEKKILSTVLYFSKKENSSLDNIEKCVKFTHISSLVPAFIFLGIAIIYITTMFILFTNSVITLNSTNFFLYFVLPILLLISLGGFFAIKRSKQLADFANSPNKNLDDIKAKLNIKS